MNPINFIDDLSWDDIPETVRHQAKRCLLDTLGVAAAGRHTETARILYNHAHRAFGGNDASLWFEGKEGSRHTSVIGAALAHGMSIDSVDMYDSCDL